MPTTAHHGPLAGITVLDLSWGIAGPMTSMLLADSGADVTHIESPYGDPVRDDVGYRVGVGAPVVRSSTSRPPRNVPHSCATPRPPTSSSSRSNLE